MNLSQFVRAMEASCVVFPMGKFEFDLCMGSPDFIGLVSFFEFVNVFIISMRNKRGMLTEQFFNGRNVTLTNQGNGPRI